MFTLTADELENAFAAINFHGYSTMLPMPPEWAIVRDNWSTVRDALCKLDLDTYIPRQPMKIFAPKDRANVRLLYLLHPEDILIYTSLVLIARDDIEAQRVPVSARRVFSFRSNPTDKGMLYRTAHSRQKYREQLKTKARNAGIKFVATADIADFYPRIYQHRLENALESAARSIRIRDVAKVLVKKFIGNLMGKNSYGIPVGPYASRVLGEATLIDVDNFLQTRSVNFVRWVDDYHLFCKTEYEAQSVLFSLGAWLFTNHGLTLQGAKTRIFPVAQYTREVLHEHEDNVTDRDQAIELLRDISAIDPTSEDAADDPKVEKVLAFLQASDLMGMLRKSLSDTALVDYDAVKFVLDKLPRIPGVAPELRKDVLDFILQNAAVLYPVAEHIASYVLSLENLSAGEQNRIASKLLGPVSSKRSPPPPYYAMWILHIFTSAPSWNHSRQIMAMYMKSNSEIVKRQASLAVHTSGKRSEALALKDDYGSASSMLKLAILMASRRLGSDERRFWKQANSVVGTLEKLI